MNEYGIIPNNTHLIHAESINKNGEIVSVCLIEEIDGVFNISVSTIDKYKNNGYANNCVRNSIIWWNQSSLHKVYDLNWWVRKDNIDSIRIAEKDEFILFDECEDFEDFIKFIIPRKIHTDINNK